MPDSFALALVVVLLGADPIPPDQAAAIALDQKAAQAEVQKKYGDKKPSELSNSERTQLIRDQAAAERKVLEKYGVDPKAWARQQMAQSPQQAAAQKTSEQQLAEQRAKQGEAAAQAKAEPQEIPVQRGFSDANPVTMEEKPSNGIPVEQGLPTEAANDQAEAAQDGRRGDAFGDKPSKGSRGGKAKGKGARAR
jgi:hypothetical protein